MLPHCCFIKPPPLPPPQKKKENERKGKGGGGKNSKEKKTHCLKLLLPGCLHALHRPTFTTIFLKCSFVRLTQLVLKLLKKNDRYYVPRNLHALLIRPSLPEICSSREETVLAKNELHKSWDTTTSRIAVLLVRVHKNKKSHGYTFRVAMVRLSTSLLAWQ